MEQLTISPFRNERPRTRVTLALRHWIHQGQLPPGQRLPSVQHLADRFRVSRPTVRAALRELKRDGTIHETGNLRTVARRQSGGGISGALLASTIAVLSDLPLEAPSHQSHPGWEAHRVAAAAAAIRRGGRHVLLLDIERLGDAIDDPAGLFERQPAGLIAIAALAGTPTGRNILRQFATMGMPVVADVHHPELQEIDTLASDHAAGAYKLTRWLIERGCKRILRVYSDREHRDRELPWWMIERNAGHERAMRDAGLEPLDPQHPLLHNTGTETTHETSRRYALANLVDHLVGPGAVDAIMAPSDGEARAILGGCRLVGRVPGKDIFVTGYDNYWMDPLPGDFGPPELPSATIDKRNRDVGRMLVELLTDRIDGRLPQARQHRLVEPELVVPAE